jgi:beta-galactosidase/beta-glucuronidase
MRESRVRPAPEPLTAVADTPGGTRNHLYWAVPVAALSLLAAIALVASVVSSSPAALAPALPSWEQPWIAEGPTNRIALREGWSVALDPHGHGQLHDWQSGNFPASAVAVVPHVMNAGQVTGNAGIKSYQGSVAWYRTTIDTPHAGTYALRFESVNFRASVYLDGKHLGGHIGTYLPFEFRFHAPAAGHHTVVVRVDWRSPSTQAREGYHRTWFNFGGINGEVTLRPIGPSDVVAPTVHTTLLPGGAALVTITAEVHNYTGTRTLALQGSLTHNGQSTGLPFAPVTLAKDGTAIATTTVRLSNPALWWPAGSGAANLYALDLKIPGESEYTQPIGLRQITWPGGRLHVNGKLVALRGASIQEDVPGVGDALDPAEQRGIVDDLLKLNANATRSQHPLDLALLEKLDAAGIMVWQGIGPVDPAGGWNGTTPQLLRDAEKRVRVTVRQAQAHPSIVAWNLANEVSGNGHFGGQASYVENMSAWIHHTDPGRMVALDIWGTHAPRTAGAMYAGVDAIGETDYIGWYQDPLLPQSELAGIIRTKLDDLHSTFPSKVLVISEFGAESNSLNPSRQPGGFGFQTATLKTHINVYRSLPFLNGMLVWDLRDFAVAPSFAGGSIRHAVAQIQLVRGLDQKGLLNYYGVPKPAFAVVANAYAAMG